MNPQEPIVKDPKVSRSNLHKLLVDKKLYSKSFEEFETQFSKEDSRYRLHQLLDQQNLYSKDYQSFDQQFFSDLKKKEFTAVGPPEQGFGSQRTFEQQPITSPSQQIVSSPPQQTDQFNEALDKENALKELEIKRQNELLRQQHPNFFKAIQEAQVPSGQFDPEKIRFEGEQKIARENRLRENLGIDEKPITLFERASSGAGSFNKPLVDLASSIPKAAAIIRKGIGELMGDSKPIQAYDAYKLGEWIDEKALEAGITATNPKLQDGFLQSTVPQALGSAFSFMLTGGVSGGSAQLGEQIIAQTTGQMAKKGAQELGQLLASRTAATGGVVMGIQEFEQAKRAGLTDEDAFMVFAKNYGIGMTEVVPIARALERINKFAGGNLSQLLATGVVGSLEEGTQEGVQQYLTNKVAQGSYDPAREPFSDMIESIGAGMFVGFVLPGIMAATDAMTSDQREQTLNIINSELKKQAAKGPKVEPKVSVNEKPIEPVAPAGEQRKQEPQPTVSKVGQEKPLPVQTQSEEPAAAAQVVASQSEQAPLTDQGNPGIFIENDQGDVFKIESVIEKNGVASRYTVSDQNGNTYDLNAQMGDFSITDKSFENAIPERSTKTVPVGEAPGGSQEVGTRASEPKPQEAPVSQKPEEEKPRADDPKIRAKAVVSKVFKGEDIDENDYKFYKENADLVEASIREEADRISTESDTKNFDQVKAMIPSLDLDLIDNQEIIKKQNPRQIKREQVDIVKEKKKLDNLLDCLKNG